MIENDHHINSVEMKKGILKICPFPKSCSASINVATNSLIYFNFV